MVPKVYKAGEICELVQVQPYVLRSWEKEFPGIGIQRTPESPRLYRQSDLEHVQRIKQLVFDEGLTVAGARRRLEETGSPTKTAAAEAAEVLEALSADARTRLKRVRDSLRELQTLLGESSRPFELTAASVPRSNGAGRAKQPKARPRPSVGKAAARKKIAPVRGKRR
jgi:DNA-binding transcriptional MerR regulator